MRFAISFLSLLISCSLFSPTLSAKPPVSVEGLRVWTNNKNKNITAKLVKITHVKADKKNKQPERIDVTFEMKTGKKITFDTNRLSAPHQKELLLWWRKNPSGIAKPTPPYKWPTQHNGDNTPKVEYVRYDEKRYAHLYKTKHFDFYCDEKLSNATISKCVALFDSIVEAIDELPLQLNTIPSENKPRYQAILLSTREKYMQMGGIKNSGGFFSPRDNLTVIPFESLGIEKKGSNWVFDGKNQTFDTLAHELTHHSTAHWIYLPVWFYEGIAEYMQAIPYQSGRFLFTNPGAAISANVRRFKGTTVENKVMPNGVFKMKHPEQLLSMSYKGWIDDLKKNLSNGYRNYASAMILTYFFMHEDGDGDGHHLIQWIHKHRAASESGRKADVEAVFKKHILRERTYKQLEAEIQDAMRKKGLRLEFAP